MLSKSFSIRRVCRLFCISETTYRYTSKLNDNNERIAQLLLDIITEHRTWGFQLCYLLIRTLDRLIEHQGKPFAIGCDNGPEYISGSLKQWAKKSEIELWYMQPGNPQQNGYVERFNRTMRYELLNQCLFESI